MPRFADHSELTFELAERIEDAVNGEMFAGLTIRIGRGASGVSVSRYLEVSFENADGEYVGEDVVIRISDHEARSYNRTGDFNISIGDCFGDAHELLRIVDLEDDGDYEGSEVDEADLKRAVDRTVEFVRRAASRAATEGE